MSEDRAWRLLRAGSNDLVCLVGESHLICSMRCKVFPECTDSVGHCSRCGALIAMSTDTNLKKVKVVDEMIFGGT
jgi:hypothetical protein